MPHSVEKVTVAGATIRLFRGGSGQPLVFLHGAGGHTGWMAFLEELSTRFAVFAPEHPGFGQSDDPPWLDAVADAFRLPRPPRVSWDEAEARIAPMLLSFMSESRRLGNARMKRELRVRLEFPTPQTLLTDIAPRALKKQLALPLGAR